MKTAGKQWRDRRRHATGKYKRFANGVYSVKRHDFHVDACEYVDPPPESCLSGQGRSGNGNGETAERATPEPVSYIHSVVEFGGWGGLGGEEGTQED